MIGIPHRPLSICPSGLGAVVWCLKASAALITTFSALASRCSSLISSEVAARAVSPARRFLQLPELASTNGNKGSGRYPRGGTARQCCPPREGRTARCRSSPPPKTAAAWRARRAACLGWPAGFRGGAARTAASTAPGCQRWPSSRSRARNRSGFPGRRRIEAVVRRAAEQLMPRPPPSPGVPGCALRPHDRPRDQNRGAPSSAADCIVSPRPKPP
jgi:hypothetical protein